MSDVVIRADGLGKRYLIGHQAAGRERYTALRDVVGRQVRGILKSARDVMHGRQIVAGDEFEEFWALRDISFEVKRGDVVGIIGRNGAGKSTLLKVLSRITEPSSGRVEIQGRVASLLEVGTGFHPELTGRENIYLNGAILGMSRAEIRRKFDEIVAFAEVEKFLDTPVKRYSSGMYVRLAFAVAAHLEPEILVVDEVLAVGDAEFQKKCLGKMQDVAGHGRTVLFVSHNMGAVRRLCRQGALLSGGSIAAIGPVERAIEAYTNSISAPSAFVNLTKAKRRGTGEGLISGITAGSLHQVPVFGSHSLELHIVVHEPEALLAIWILLRNSQGDDVAMLMQKDNGGYRKMAGNGKVRCEFEAALAPGRYSMTVGLLDKGGGIVDWVDDAMSLDVASCFADGSPFDNRLGLTTIRARWLDCLPEQT